MLSKSQTGRFMRSQTPSRFHFSEKMQSSSFHLSRTSYSKPKIFQKFPNAGSYRPSQAFKPPIHGGPSSLSSSFSSANQFPKPGRRGFTVLRAASLPESRDESRVKMGGIVQSLKLAAMFGAWYLLNIYFNILNKQVLQIFPFPVTVSAFQFGCGGVFAMLMWALNLHQRPKIAYCQVSAIMALGVAHATGNLLTNVSLGRQAVSFTHTIKAMEPFFTVLLSALFLGQSPSIWVLSSLVPIVGGVALASCTELSFNWIGFSSAMASNLVNQSRNVFSKKLMVGKEETLDDINLFSVMTIISFTLLLPIAVLIEGTKFTPSYLRYAAESRGLSVKLLATKFLLSAFCLHYYQQVSYVILHMVSPVSHSVGNCLKRVIVIVASVIFFRTPVSHASSLGTALALFGVFLYTRARRVKPKMKET